jgi:hypothetical protein
MFHMWLLWFKNRWRGAGAAVVAALIVGVIALVALSRSGTGISFLGDAGAARPAVASGPSGAMLPRSGIPLVSALDQPLPSSAGPQTVAEAQARWSAAEIAQHQEAMVAAVNCARLQQGQPVLTLDSALSATAGDAWLHLIHTPSWSLMQLPGTYALRGVVALDDTSPDQAAAQAQHTATGQANAVSRCTVGGFDATSLTLSADVHTIGIAVFPPQAAWDSASAIVLVQ